MLKKNGRLYLSTPIGKERVEFNANWVFNPETIYTMGRENGLSLEKCMIITEGKVKEYTEPVSHFSNWSQSEYLLCVFCFIKV
jgi:hypothetical protein